MCSDLESRKRGFSRNFKIFFLALEHFLKVLFFLAWLEEGNRECWFFSLGNRNVTPWLAVKSWSSRSSFFTFSVWKTPPFLSPKLYEPYSICSMVIFAKTCPKKLVVNARKNRKTCWLSVNLKPVCWFAVDQPSILLYTQGGGEWLRYKGKVVQV